MTFYICIRKVLRSNGGLDTGYHKLFSGFQTPTREMTTCTLI